MTHSHLALYSMQLSWKSNGDLFQRLWVQTPPGSEIFSLSPHGPISFLGLTLRRYYLGYLLEHFNLSHLNHRLCIYTDTSLIHVQNNCVNEDKSQLVLINFVLHSHVHVQYMHVILNETDQYLHEMAKCKTILIMETCGTKLM